MESFDDDLTSSKWTFTQGSYSATSRTGPRAWTFGIGQRLDYGIASADEDATIIAAFGLQVAGAGTLMSYRSDSGATFHLHIVHSATGSIDVYRGYGVTFLGGSGAGTLANGSYYWVEIKATLSDTVGVVQIKVNGATVLNLTGQDTKNGGTKTKWDMIRFGNADGDTNNVYLDDIILMNTAGTVNNDFIGDSTVQAYFPDGNGNYSQWVGSDGDSINNYQLVDEASPISTADYVQSGTSGNKDSYAFANIANTGATIKALALRCYMKKDDSGARTARSVTRIAGVDYNSSDFALGTGYLLFTEQRETSPASGVAWTPTEINAAEFGVECRP